MLIDNYAVSSHLRQLANELKGHFAGGSIEILSHESRFDINIYPPTDVFLARPTMQISARFEIKTAVTSYSNFMVRKSDVFDWIAEHIFLHHDFQTGDDLFNNSFVVTVDDTKWASKYFGQSIVRSTISDILSAGFHRVHCVGNELKVDKFLKSLEDCPSSKEISDIIDKLSSLISIHPS